MNTERIAELRELCKGPSLPDVLLGLGEWNKAVMTALPELLDEVERLQREVDYYRAHAEGL